ncbi:MAG TPA: hypothetical protein VFW98_06560 [Gemmatimonadaceae bacterium]|nr:hypothetical protein [Gemmatimonadaceae bacterium]
MHPSDETLHDYRIEKRRVAITLTMVGGEELHGHIFVQPSTYGLGGPEHPTQLFNSAEPFVPLVQYDGEVLLVAKDRVIEVTGLPPGEDDPLQRDCARPSPAEITLAGGIVLTGAIRLETPSRHPRLQDFLNQHTERFITLDTTEGMHLINLRLIDRIRPLD